MNNIFNFYLPTRIVHGQNSIQEAGNLFKDLGATKALIITDEGVSYAGLLEGLYDSLKSKGVPYVVFDGVEEDPGEMTIANGVNFALKEKCDGIIALGGGSVICAARGIGVVATNGGKIKDYAGIGKASKMPLPLIAIPTTAGSGAEVSQVFILKDEEYNLKMIVAGPLYFPRAAILDTLLLRTLPFRQAAASGIDALSHAIEAFLTTLTTPITDAIALTALNLIYNNLRTAAATDDLDAKEACLIGSAMANMACGNSQLGLAHFMTIPTEGMFKIPHGIDLGILLPQVMDFNLPVSYERFAVLAKTMGEPENGRSMRDFAPCAITAVKRLLVDLGFPNKFPEDQFDPKAIPHMAKVVTGGIFGRFDPEKEMTMDTPVPAVNIRKATMKDVIDLFEKCFQGWRL
jgi:alcohol dehydrogenase class IV